MNAAARLVIIMFGIQETAVIINPILLVDFAVMWGVLAWLLGYIPTVGFWLALMPPSISEA